jgi:hypothetical protein
MAAGQLSDVGRFARILAAYRLLPGVPTLAVWILIATEALAGVALLRGARGGTRTPRGTRGAGRRRCQAEDPLPSSTVR